MSDWIFFGALTALAFALAWMVLDRRFQLPLLMETGMCCAALGLLAGAEALHNPSACEPGALTLRWSLVGGGLTLMLVSHQLERKKRRRAGDRLGANFTSARG